MTDSTGKAPPWPDNPTSRLVTARELAASASARAKVVASLQARGSNHQVAITQENLRIAEGIDETFKAIGDESLALRRKPFWLFYKAVGRLSLLIASTWIMGLLWFLARIAFGIALGYLALVYVLPAIVLFLWMIFRTVLGF